MASVKASLMQKGKGHSGPLPCLTLRRKSTPQHWQTCGLSLRCLSASLPECSMFRRRQFKAGNKEFVDLPTHPEDCFRSSAKNLKYSAELPASPWCTSREFERRHLLLACERSSSHGESHYRQSQPSSELTHNAPGLGSTTNNVRSSESWRLFGEGELSTARGVNNFGSVDKNQF